MSYHFSELHRLADWIRQQGGDPSSFVSERQAAFIAQKLAGTRYKFPAKGASCFEVLKKIEREIKLNPELRARSIRSRRTPKKGNLNKGKKGKGGAKRPLNKPDYLGLSVFADGAAVPNPGAGGWGVVAYHNREEIHWSRGGDPVTTNNEMELIGLLEALEWVRDNHPDEEVNIFLDSKYAINCATLWVDGWLQRGWLLKGGKPIQNLPIIQSIYWVKAKLPMASILWVPGHSGDLGNERADALAEQGRVIGAAAMNTDGKKS